MVLYYCFWLVLIVSVTKVCYAQCMVRTLIPMTMMDSYAPCAAAAEDSTTSAEDLNALLLLARALEMDRANSSNNGIDVNSLLHTLINALVYTATQNSGRGFQSGYSENNNWQNNSPNVSPNYPTNSSPTSNNNHKSGKDGSGLIDVQLLGKGKNNVAEVDISGKPIVGLGLASDKNASGNNSGGEGLLGGVTNTVGGILSGLTGENGLL